MGFKVRNTEKRALDGHRLIRPDSDSKDVLRLVIMDSGRTKWIPDDGRPGFAFSGFDEELFPIAWACDCDCSMLDDKCPSNISMDKTSHRFGCANAEPGIRA